MFVGLEKLINPNDRVAVAISGGKDSVCLLHALLENAKKLNYSVSAINVEHGIRGQQSLNDTAFVKALCQEWRVTLYTFSVDAIEHSKANKLCIEESARILRYECFYRAISDGFADKVATAHHLSDNAESVLFNLFRGTGVKGAVGIESNFNDKIIRPFLQVTTTQIEDYISKHNLKFVTDSTNFDDDYTRNALRHKVLPQIKELFPQAEKSIKRFGEIIKQA